MDEWLDKRSIQFLGIAPAGVSCNPHKTQNLTFLRPYTICLYLTKKDISDICVVVAMAPYCVPATILLLLHPLLLVVHLLRPLHLGNLPQLFSAHLLHCMFWLFLSPLFYTASITVVGNSTSSTAGSKCVSSEDPKHGFLTATVWCLVRSLLQSL